MIVMTNKIGDISLPVAGWKSVVKRLMDICVSLCALVVFLPAFVIIPVLIKLEDPADSVFFRQKRYGRGGSTFDCLKFRSMRQDKTGNGEIKLTERDDPRVLKIGKFIRRTSLDELPQFLNVLKGDMSAVGPRPHPPGVKAAGRYYEDIIPNFMDRYAVRPGLTGLAQVNGWRGNTFTEDDIKGRFDCDMYYIKHWSLWMDVVIVLRTMVMGFTGKNAF